MSEAETAGQITRNLTKHRVKRATEQWDGAPATIKLMAAPYMAPILEALNAINSELDQIKGGTNGKA